MDLDCSLPKMLSLADVHYAKYNPRKISDAQMCELCKSIKMHGIVIPILVNARNNVILAGHQRSRAARKVGMEKIPAILVNGIGTITDEIRFNQLHNGSFVATATCNAEVFASGFKMIHPKKFNKFNVSASRVNECAKLMLKYGNIFSAVLVSGQVIYGAEYIRACQLLGAKQCLCYVCNNDNGVIEHLKAEYGRYSYENLQKNTYVQGLAQLNRSLSKTSDKKAYRSMLYEHHVLPYLKQGVSVLDFGCGKGAYIKYLQSCGYRAVGIEFYPNNGKQIIISKAKKALYAALDDIENNGLFDIVVCDSVLNSVDSIEAENAVMGVLNACCKNTLYISGRPLCDIKKKIERDKAAVSRPKCDVFFLDENNFTATYREGNWYYQHFHDIPEIKYLLQKNGFEIVNLDYNKFGSSWQVTAKRIKQLPLQRIKDAILFEFGLPLPCDQKYEFGDLAWRAISKHL